jgi:hypothetical protein
VIEGRNVVRTTGIWTVDIGLGNCRTVTLGFYILVSERFTSLNSNKSQFTMQILLCIIRMYFSTLTRSYLQSNFYYPLTRQFLVSTCCSSLVVVLSLSIWKVMSLSPTHTSRIVLSRTSNLSAIGRCHHYRWQSLCLALTAISSKFFYVPHLLRHRTSDFKSCLKDPRFSLLSAMLFAKEQLLPILTSWVWRGWHEQGSKSRTLTR